MTLGACRERREEGWAEIVNKCVGLFVSANMKENIHCIPLAYCTLDSLDIFNLILIALRPRLTGVLFDLILKFRAALTLSLLPLLFSRTAPFLSCLAFIRYFISAACVHLHTNVGECKLVHVRMCVFECVCSWMTGQGL